MLKHYHFMVSFVLLVNSLANCMDYNPNSTYNLNTNNSGYHTHQNFIPKSMVGDNQSDIGTFRYSNQNTAIAGYFNNDNLLVSRNTYDDMGLTIQKQQDAIDLMEKQLKFFQEQWEKITNQNINLEANNNQNNTDNTNSIQEGNDNWSTISNCSQQTNLLETNDNTSQKNLQSETKSNTELLAENKRLRDELKILKDENQVLRDKVALAKTNLESVQGQLQIVKDNNQDLQDTIDQLYFCNEQLEDQKRCNYYWNKKLVNTNRCLRKQLSYAKSRAKSVNNSTISFNTSRSNNYSNINNIRTIANNYNISNNTKSINSKQRLNRNYSTRNLSYNSQFVPNHEQTYSELLAGQINDLSNQLNNPNKFTNKKSYKLLHRLFENQNSAINSLNNQVDKHPMKNIIKNEKDANELLGKNFEVNNMNSNSTHLTKNSMGIDKDIQKSNDVINNDNKEDEKVVDHSDNIDKWNNSEDYNNMNNINNNLEFKSIKFNLDNNNKGKLDYLLTTDKYNDKYNDKYSVITETNREDNTTVYNYDIDSKKNIKDQQNKKHKPTHKKKKNTEKIQQPKTEMTYDELDTLLAQFGVPVSNNDNIITPITKQANQQISKKLTSMKQSIEELYGMTEYYCISEVTAKTDGEYKKKITGECIDSIIANYNDITYYLEAPQNPNGVGINVLLNIFKIGQFSKILEYNEAVKDNSENFLMLALQNKCHMPVNDNVYSKTHKALYNMLNAGVFSKEFVGNSEDIQKINVIIQKCKSYLRKYFEYITIVKNNIEKKITNYLKLSQKDPKPLINYILWQCTVMDYNGLVRIGDDDIPKSDLKKWAQFSENLLIYLHTEVPDISDKKQKNSFIKDLISMLVDNYVVFYKIRAKLYQSIEKQESE